MIKIKLIDYIIKNDKSIDIIKLCAKEIGMSIKDYITTGYCPLCFECLNGTEYGKFYKPTKKDKNDC